MNIVNTYNPINPINKKTLNKTSNNQITFSKLSQLKADVFEPFREIEQTPGIKLDCKLDIQKIYDEVYEIFKQQNPMFDELHIPKPKIKTVNNLFKEFTGEYSFYNNTIQLNNSFINTDYYLCYAKNNSGQKYPLHICLTSQLDETKNKIKSQLEDINCTEVEITKLTEQEKMLWIKSLIAHELRHCLQHHMMASMGKQNIYLAYEKYLIKKLIKSQKEVADLSKQALDLCPHNEYETRKRDYIKALNDLEKSKNDEYSYILNFKPYKILDGNTKLKFSLDPEDIRYWSVKKHFMKASFKYNRDDKIIYYSSPLEIDAYHYEQEFIFSQSDKFRKDCTLAMGMNLINSYENGLMNLKKNGFKELIQQKSN